MPSFHATILMTEWLVKTDDANKKREMLNELASIPFEQRKENEKIKRIISTMYNVWSRSNKKIERLAVLGWNEIDMRVHLCALIEKLPQIRLEYEQMKNKFGVPEAIANRVTDKKVKRYEREVHEILKNSD